jgi:hypothetical protein
MTTCPTCQLEFAGKLLQRFCSRPCQKAASNAVRATGNSTGRPSKSPRRQVEAASPIPTTQAMPARIPASYTGDDGKVWHCIQIAKVSPIQWSATYGDVVLGQWRDVERCAPRALITAGLASREDWMLTFVGGAPATRCNIGWPADRTAADPDRGSPHWTKWRPFQREAEELAIVYKYDRMNIFYVTIQHQRHESERKSTKIGKNLLSDGYKQISYL